MKIIIDVNGEGVNQVSFEDCSKDDKITYDDLIATFLAVMEKATLQFIKQTKAEKWEKEHLYDVLDTLFYKFMCRTFPDIQPREFDFSDAAVLYAQDQIIEEAEREGLSFDEVMEKYENRARAYIRACARPQ